MRTLTSFPLQYINHGSMEQLLQRRGEELPWSVRLSLALDVAKGIAYLHSRGMFHRDLTSKVGIDKVVLFAMAFILFSKKKNFFLFRMF